MRLLAEFAPKDGRVLAGGQSLVPMMNFRLARPAYLIDINAVAGLDRLDAEDGVLAHRCAGAACRLPSSGRAGPAGGDAGQRGPAYRALSDPHRAALFAAALRTPIRLRSGAWWRRRWAPKWLRVSARGERRLRGRDFFQGPMTTALEADELLAEARLPLLPAGTRFGFAEFSRRAGDFAMAMALAVLESKATSSLGRASASAAPKPYRAASRGRGGAARREAGRSGVPSGGRGAAAAAIDPIDDSADRCAIPARAGRRDGVSRAEAGAAA